MSFSQSENSSHSKVIRSCDSKIGEDLVDPSSQVKMEPRMAKSYQSASEDEENWDDFTEEEMKARKKDFSKGFAEKKSKKNTKKKASEREPGNFVDEIIDSEEISVKDSSIVSPSERIHENGLEENQKMNEDRRKETAYFNILLAGAASTGKTTYMECMTRKYKHQNREPQLIRKHTDNIVQVETFPSGQNLNLDFRIIDTPGFTHSSTLDYVGSIKAELRRRIVKFEEEVKKTMTESSIYSREEKEIRDCRIHCCLFFFRGPRIHEDDWLILKELHSICNIIPVIAKGDSYSIQEVCELKKSLCRRREDESITWFNIEEYMRQKHQDNLGLIKGPYGLCPPFMIACSTTQIEFNHELKIAREFKWGTCLIENSEHTQFSQLKTLLLKFLRKGLVGMTDIKCKRQSEMIASSQRKNSVKKVFGFLSGAVTLVGIVVFVNKKVMHNQ